MTASSTAFDHGPRSMAYRANRLARMKDQRMTSTPRLAAACARNPRFISPRSGTRALKFLGSASPEHLIDRELLLPLFVLPPAHRALLRRADDALLRLQRTARLDQLERSTHRWRGSRLCSSEGLACAMSYLPTWVTYAYRLQSSVTADQHQRRARSLPCPNKSYKRCGAQRLEAHWRPSIIITAS
jgi:hypothetical protein